MRPTKWTGFLAIMARAVGGSNPLDFLDGYDLEQFVTVRLTFLQIKTLPPGLTDHDSGQRLEHRGIWWQSITLRQFLRDTGS